MSDTPGATTAANSLRNRAIADFRLLATATARVSSTAKALNAANGDLEPAMLGAWAYILAIEELSAQAGQMAKDARAALIQCLQETGAPPIRTSSHTISLRTNAETVTVLDRNAVPDECLVTIPEERKPDKARMLAYLRRNPNANWGEIVHGTVSLQARSIT